jgi:hypothetical protein
MKRSLLLAFSVTAVFFSQAQKQKSAAYAITSVQKGASSWTEVRLVDLATGEELKTIYQSAGNADILNARTGKAVRERPLSVPKGMCGKCQGTSPLPPHLQPVPLTKRTTAFIIHPWASPSFATLT